MSKPYQQKSQKKYQGENQRMPYTERIKNFDGIRNYLRDFYVNGFHTRDDFGQKKSGRSYDDARRRVEDYLGDYSGFHAGKNGKAVYISMDSRLVQHNPLYMAFRTRSFTDKDIVLHFFILDVLSSGKALTPIEIINGIDQLNSRPDKMEITEATLRKKLKEYMELGILKEIRSGGKILYKLNARTIDVDNIADAVDFFMEESPVGVIGSYVSDHVRQHDSVLRFRNHYFMNACDSLILETVLQGIHEKRAIRINYTGKNGDKSEREMVPLKLYINTIGGRSYLIGKDPEREIYSTFRIDRTNKAELSEKVDGYTEIAEGLKVCTDHLWGVSGIENQRLEHLEMEINAEPDEPYIIERLNREKRQGTLTQLDCSRWLFSIDVYDTMEMVPWIRSYYGRIVRFSCDNKEVEHKVKRNVAQMMEMYGD